MTDSTLYASVPTGAVPSAADMDRGTNKFNSASPPVSRWPSSVACRFHQTVATPLCCCVHVSPNLVLSSGSTRRSSSRRESLVACVVGKYACWMGGSRTRCQTHTHASISTALISLSCLLTWELRWRRLAKRIACLYLQRSSDFMTCSRSPRRSTQTSKCSCASATSCCVCGHADDEASLTTCATCMMYFHKECVETFVQYVVGLGKVSSIHCQCSPLS